MGNSVSTDNASTSKVTWAFDRPALIREYAAMECMTREVVYPFLILENFKCVD